MRTLVEVGIPKFRLKTVKALVDHIIQTVPNPSGGYCEPIASAYFKVLKTVLEHPAHPEHLSHEEWHDLVDFCIQATKNLIRLPSEDTADPSNADEEILSSRGRLSRSATPSIRSASATQRPNATSSGPHHENQMRALAEDVILCLGHLASTSNAPVLEKASSIVETMLYFLSTSTHSAPVQQAAFETVNAILYRTSTNDVSLTLRTVSELIPIMKRHWPKKWSTLKDHMLVSLLLVEPYLSHLISSYTEDEAEDLVGLIDVMRDEYCRRHDKDQLQVDDLCFANTTRADQTGGSLNIPAIQPRFGHAKAEAPWSVIYISASMIASLNRRWEALDDRANGVNGGHGTKRRKIESPIDSVFQRLKSSTLADKIYAMQVLCFLFDMGKVRPALLLGYLETMLQQVLDRNASVCSWAMLAIRRCVSLRLPTSLFHLLISQCCRTRRCAQLKLRSYVDSDMAYRSSTSDDQHDLQSRLPSDDRFARSKSRSLHGCCRHRGWHGILNGP